MATEAGPMTDKAALAVARRLWGQRAVARHSLPPNDHDYDHPAEVAYRVGWEGQAEDGSPRLHTYGTSGRSWEEAFADAMLHFGRWVNDP